ncbi:universal stress protein [Halosimplex pelagicum]|uniref:Universal stress protein n=1 Tax=Halosimplex pelagicum TaxID=869886 RepID=A0A7D5TCE7_9EURY|nr:universal stress protein [Halosimplex pelagicum]QLH82889.1 universal stress protein [Halosimplex pelagicum]
MYESILAPTDGSPTADLAADHALALAAAFDASVTALGVVDAEEAAGPFDAGGVDDDYLDRLETEAQRSVDSVAERTDGRVPVDAVVVDGDPTETIVDRAADHDLVVLGTHGRSTIDRVLTGSTSAGVVRESPAPVVTVRSDDGESGGGDESATGEGSMTGGDSPFGYDDVLVPTDGSAAAEAAVDHGLAVADAFDATVHAVHVVDVSAVAGGAGVAAGAGGAGAAGAGGDLLEPMIENGEEATERVAERARGEGLDAVTDVGEGSPGSMLVDYVDEEGIDFVTMGTHGHTGLDRVLLGSTTERLMRNVSVPVLSVRESEDDAAE